MEREILRFSDDFGDHIDQIARLKAENWDLDFEVFRSYVKWNYLERLHTKPPVIYFVRAEEEIVAMRAVYETVWRLKDPSSRFSALCSADILILKEYRNKGIYRELESYVMDDLRKMGVEYLFSFNATPLNVMISLSSGWKSMGEIKIIKKQFETKGSTAIAFALKSAGPYVRKLLGKTGMSLILRRRGRDNSRRIDEIYHRPRTRLSSNIMLHNKPRPADMANLVNNTVPEDKITLLRDESFFHWRYNSPLSKYLFLYWYDNGLKGYLVLQSHLYSVEPGGSHNIFELEATGPSVRIELLDALMSLVDSGSISAWVSMLDRDSYDFLLSRGFKEDNSTKSVKEVPRTMMLRPLDGHDNKIEFRGLSLLEANSWDFKMLYMHDH